MDSSLHGERLFRFVVLCGLYCGLHRSDTVLYTQQGISRAHPKKLLEASLPVRTGDRDFAHRQRVETEHSRVLCEVLDNDAWA